MVAAAARGFAVSARAKFNVRLEVGARRADGFHAVRSVIADLGVGDEIDFRHARAFSLDCDDASIAPQANLALVAARALAIDLPAVHVLIKKRLPKQAGLGGGSADAAAVLRGIARVALDAGETISDAALFAAAAKTGSDVAACLLPGLKVAEGRGELVRQLGFEAPAWGVLLLKPAIGVDTTTAYRVLDDARASGAAPAGDDGALDRLVRALEARDFVGACALARNDFQAPIEAAYPAVARARTRLEAAGAPTAILCGSGSCVAGLFPTVDAARVATDRIALADGEWSCATGFHG